MTLTQTAVLTKRLVIILVILISLGTIGKIGFDTWQRYQLSLLPPPEERAEMGFGSLTPIKFPANKISSSNFSYSVDTSTGGLPQTPKIFKVYFIPEANLSLLSADKAASLATNLGFPKGPEIISDDVYKFTDTNQGELKINIRNGNFEFQRLPVWDNTSLNTPFPDEQSLVQIFRNFLTSKNLLRTELVSGRSALVIHDLEKEASKTAEVSLWPSDFEGTKIVTSGINRGPIRGFYSPHDLSQDKFTKVTYSLWTTDPTSFSTYPIKSPEQALDDLKRGQGFISLEPKNPQVSITSAFLAYFQTEQYSPYLQPVYVFEGSGFMGLVPAINY